MVLVLANPNLMTPSMANAPLSSAASNVGGVPPQFLPPGATGGAAGPGMMPPPNYWDWWNYYPNPSPFDMGYRDEMSKK